METLVIRVDTKSNASKIREAVSLFRGVKEVSIEKIPNAITQKAINDARNGKVFKAKSAKHLFDTIR